jgi:hypothetical protein
MNYATQWLIRFVAAAEAFCWDERRGHLELTGGQVEMRVARRLRLRVCG